MIQQIPIRSRDEWLALRRSDVTASAAGALLGVHDYQSALGLWALKSGKVTEDVEETSAMVRGLLLEPVGLKLLRMQRPDWKLEWNGEPGELSGSYFRDEEHRIGATPDCFAIDERGRKGVVQFKSVEQSIFRKKWFGSNDDGAPSEMMPPLWVSVQAIIEASLVGAEWAAVAPLVIGFGLDLHVIEVPIHAGVIDRVCLAVADFWRRVAENDPPDADYGRDGKIISSLYNSDNGLEIDLSRDNRVPALCEEREQLLAIRKEADEKLDAIKCELREKIGPNSVGFAQGWQISNKLSHRSGYTVEPKDIRYLRTKRIGNRQR
jgi:hypothetical protein